ncbi:MAG: hypothetical protein OEM82_05530 [Acidobacteriota bacterium]|nr:hypothetical protein [Acidobacteriota bacterium]MDH3529740.1 hypothetical protein [Acidobacteriota bacterium]
MYKILSFLSALSIGLSLAFVVNGTVSVISGEHQAVTSAVNPAAACDASRPVDEGVSVDLTRIVTDGQGSRAEFLISNNGCMPVKYWGYAKNSPLHRIKIDGEEEQQFWCGTGLEEFELYPGEALSVSLPANLFTNTGKNGSNYSVGFMSSWSNEFRLPEVR